MRIGQHGGKLFLLQSEQYRKYEKDSLFQLRQHRPEQPISTPVNVCCTYYMPTRRRVDLLNLLAATSDILVKAGVLEDDNCKIMVSTDGSRVKYDRESPRVDITISDFL